MTADITRLFPDRDTRFHALVRQQGRLPIDAEENLASDLAEWEREDAFTEAIAPSGSPDDGFRISLPVGGPPADFTIAAGSYYLGGARVENPAPITYRGQRTRNWLTFPTDAESLNPADPNAANEAIGTARKFLVWLDAADAVVTATEDAELRDPGLGGADGSAAKRFSWHVRTTPVAGPGCVLARQQWLAVRGWTGKVDDTGALRSGAALTVGFNPADVDQDLCAPSLTPGYLGARNECYRVMISRPGRFVWGRDDAAPLYRVRVEAIAGQLRRIVFLTQPRDEYIRPRAGQTVELLRWDERLPNGQKTAERIGDFFTVATGFADGSITLTTPVDATRYTNWLSGLPATAESAEDPATERRYFYLRLWTGGGAGGQADHPLSPGDLTGTGLRLTFAAGGFVGDHWVIAARPNAPTQLLPWALKTGKLPDGPRRHVVPLAFVDLDAGTVTDCRRRFRPLFKQGGCCTVTVGDNENSWGDVSSIADAIARLPASGGEICIGPGRWDETIDLTGRRDIVFTGCGRRTRWFAGDPAQPLLRLTNCQGISVRRIAMTSADAPCILTDRNAAGVGVSNVTVEDCHLSTPSGGVVRTQFSNGFRISRCHVRSGPLPNATAANAAFSAITLHGSDLCVVDSTIVAEIGSTAQTLPLGGIHIRGNSTQVDICRNDIGEGAGNGITLGSVRMIRIPAPSFTSDPDKALEDGIRRAGGALNVGGFTVDIDPAGCIRIVPQNPDPTNNPDNTITVPVSDGTVARVRIAENRISNCGASGIASFPLLPVSTTGDAAWDGIAVDRVLIEANEIVNNVRREQAPLLPLQAMFAGAGGIALSLASDLTIRDNEIRGNGAEPSRIASGIFVGYGEAVRVERNRIEENGKLSATVGGSTGGIVVRAAIGGAAISESMLGDRDRPALLVQNNLVHAPTGRALKVLAHGPVMVNANRLTGANQSSLFADPLQAIILFILGIRTVKEVISDPAAAGLVDLVLFDAVIDVMGGDAVSIVNLGWAEDYLLAFSLGRLMPRLASGAGSQPLADVLKRQGLSMSSFRGGETMFNDNQVALRRGLGTFAGHVSSILIGSMDDVSYADNQTDVEFDVTLVVADTLLLAMTLRATGNRVQESAIAFVSLLTNGRQLNTTAHNQTTLALSALCDDPAKLVEEGNTTFF